jgi:ATP-binding cassette subfamily C protein/ATP-binding cassette subfamily C protein LapB
MTGSGTSVTNVEHPLAKFGVILDHRDPDEHARDLTAAVCDWAGSGMDMVACLPVLLAALNWNGNPRALADAMPPRGEVFDITAFKNLMGQLNFASTVHEGHKISATTHLPAVVLRPGIPAIVVLAIEDGKTANAFDTQTGTIKEFPVSRLTGTVLTFEAMIATAEKPGVSWYRTLMRRFSRVWVFAFMLTGLSNLLALSVPLFVLFIYDRVIPTGSMLTLIGVTSGVGLALLTDIIVRKIRRRLINFAATRIGFMTGTEVFGRLLTLPTAMTEKASIGAQVSRIRDLERVKEFIAGPLGLAVLDIPFIIIFIVAIAIVAGWLAAVPLVAAIIYVLSGISFSRTVAREIEVSARLNTRRQEIIIEVVQRLRAIRAAGVTRAWVERFDAISTECARENAKNARITSLMSVFSQGLMLFAGLVTLGAGVHLVIAGDVTTGGLIASMILVWRAMAPMQGLFIFLTRIDQLKNSVIQTNRLLTLDPERSGGLPVKELKGLVEFANVTFRYPGAPDPAFSNVSFKAEPGQVTAIIGKNGSGKSSVLKLIAGLYQPLAGNIKIDDRDIRQIDPRELRQMIAYVSQSPHFFNGSIAENLRMSDSLASHDEIVAALEMAGVWDDIDALPDKLDTVISARQAEQFSNSLMMRLSLARAYLRKAPIVLLDEPITGLDFEAEFYFTAAIDHLQKTSTVFIVTHRPSHLRAADNVLILENGLVRYFGSAAEVRDKIPSHLI